MSIEVKISKRRISYKIAMKILHKRVEELKVNKGRELLWILEHPVTYTAGIRSDNKEIIDTELDLDLFIDKNEKYSVIWYNIEKEVNRLSKYFISKLNFY